MYDPASSRRYLGYKFLIVAVVAAAVVAINRRYFFHTTLYEYGDLAANSLDVLRAKAFECRYGAYSRWGFHHPGPILFYCLALGETLFWQVLHLVPTPFNAQTLTILLITASFLAAGIGTAARWVRSPFFLPLALLVAALHLTSIHLDVCLMSSWPPFVMPVPFFCLLVVAASVAAGRGEDLPSLALTGGFILHSHVAHPLFVLPLFGIAYAGLWRSCARTTEPTADPSARPWQRFPRAHGLSAAIVAIFALPVVLDLSRGADSNMVLIWRHLRTHRGEHHPWLDAVSYFLRFGTYRPPTAVAGESVGNLLRYVASHPEMFGLWLAALLSPGLALGLRHRLRVAASAPVAPDPISAGRWSFLRWLAVCLAVTTALAIFWAHIQDGPLYFYNAVFNYGIYLALAMLAAVACSDLLETLTARLPRPSAWKWVAALFCFGGIAVVYGEHPERFQATQGDGVDPHRLARTVLAALVEHPEAPRIKYLGIPDETALESAPAVAVLLKRQGYDFRVAPKWKTMLGNGTALADPYPATLLAAQKQRPMEFWHLSPAAVAPQAAAQRPLLQGWALETECVEIDPSPTASIVFAGPEYNGSKFHLQGIALPGPGMGYTLTTEKVAVVDFKPGQVPADCEVEIAVDYINSFGDPRKHPFQRLLLNFNGLECGAFSARVDAPMPTIRALIPASRWNAAQPVALLSLEFPDAIRPGEIDPANQDPRQIAFTIMRLDFRLITSPVIK